MAIRHVRDYYERMVSDYVEMKRVLEEMEKLSNEKASIALSNLDQIKEQVKILEANYKRLAYVMFLLDQPNRKSKKQRYLSREKKKLDNIPKKDRKEAIIEENSRILETLKSYF